MPVYPTLIIPRSYFDDFFICFYLRSYYLHIVQNNIVTQSAQTSNYAKIAILLFWKILLTTLNVPSQLMPSPETHLNNFARIALATKLSWSKLMENDRDWVHKR